MSLTADDLTRIPGWGVDADPENDPTWPMRDRSKEEEKGLDWKRPPQQPQTVEILQSIEHNRLPAVFGESTPPSGLSGVLRRKAFVFSESQWAHWLLLILADRVNSVEGVVQDLGRGRVPNIFAEMGLGAQLKHNRRDFTEKVVVAGLLAGVAILACRMIAHRR
jgi:hypothetical protein